MKDWRIMGLLAVLILGFLLISGCTSPGSSTTAPLATPIQQKINTMTTVSVSTMPISTQPQTLQYSTVSKTTTTVSSLPEVCGLIGNGWQNDPEIRIPEAGIQTFEMKHLRNHHFYIGLYKREYQSIDNKLIRWLSEEQGSVEYKADCATKPGAGGSTGHLEYGSYKEDFVWVNTSEFLEPGEYEIFVDPCGPWEIKISHCHVLHYTVPTSVPGITHYPAP